MYHETYPPERLDIVQSGGYHEDMITKDQIQAVADKIAKEFQPEKIILFGSYAWGKPGPNSDVDVLVIKDTPKKRWEREYELRSKLIGNHFPPLDVLIYTPTELENRKTIGDLFVADIITNGTILYAR